MQNNYDIDDPVRSPIIQDMIMSYRIGEIASIIAQRLDIKPLEALKLFYRSKTCGYLHDRENDDLYLFGNLYIVNDFLTEYSQQLL